MKQPQVRTCYLHIGTIKTGSTTIQGFLHTHRDALAKAGVDTPLFGAGDIFEGGFKLAAAFGKEPSLAEPKTAPWRAFKTYLGQTTGDFCVSRESFCTFLDNREKLDSLEAFLAPHGVRLKTIAYVRDTVGLVNANYTQAVKRFAQGKRFEKWADTMIARPRQVLTNYSLFEHLLKSRDTEVVIRPFEALGPKGLIGDFVAQIDRPDFDWSGFDDQPYRNPSPGTRTIAASLLVARALEAKRKTGEFADYDKTRELGRRFRAITAARGWTDKPFYGPDPEIAAKLGARFAEENERFAQAAWGRSWADVVPRVERSQSIYELAKAPKSERREIRTMVEDFVQALIDETKRRAAGESQPRAGFVTAAFPGD